MKASCLARPTWREWAQAVLLAGLCALLFLREGVLPTRAVVPFAPECYQPARATALADGTVSAAELELGNRSFGDKYNQSLAWDRIIQDRIRTGSLPLWTRDIGGGAPFVPQMAQVYKPWNLLLLTPVPSAGMYGPWYAMYLVVWGTLAWFFLRRIGLGHGAALFGLTCAVLCLWVQARIHHNVIMSPALPLWPLLTLIHGAFARRCTTAGTIAGIGLCLGFSWSGGFAPVSLQVTYLALGWALVQAAHTRCWRPLLGIGMGFTLGAALAAAQMIPVLLASAISARVAASADLLVLKSLGVTELLGLVFTDLLHWPSGPEPWPTFKALELTPKAILDARTAMQMPPTGDYPESAFAIGTPAVVGLAAVLTRPKGVALWFFLATAAVAFGLALAIPPFLQLSAVVPGARAGDLRRFLFVASVAITVLAAIGVDRLAKGGRLPTLVGALAAIGIFALAGWWGWLDVAPTLDSAGFRDVWADRLAAAYGVDAETVRNAILQRPAEAPWNRSMLAWCYGRTMLVAGSCVLVLLVFRGAGRAVALATITAIELTLAGSGTIVPVAVERVTTPPAILRPALDANAAALRDEAPRPRLFRLEAPTASRILDLTPPNLGAYFGLEDLGAYNPLPPRRMEELFFAIEPDPRVVTGGAGVQAFYDPRSLQHPLLDILGIRFVLSARDDLVTGDGLIDRTPEGTPAPYRLYERTTTAPRATFLDRSLVIPDPAQRLARLADRQHDPRSTVIVERGNELTGDGIADAEVTVLHHRDEEVALHVVNREPGYLRLADPYDAGWTALVDGVAAPVLIADHHLRALRLAPGDHVIRFRYDGLRVVAPRWISLAGLAIVLGLLVRALFDARARAHP